mgnify:CR=1 FL=1
MKMKSLPIFAIYSCPPCVQVKTYHVDGELLLLARKITNLTPLTRSALSHNGIYNNGVLLEGIQEWL